MKYSRRGNMETVTITHSVAQDIEKQGYSVVPANKCIFPDNLVGSWKVLQNDWDDLELDIYMKDGGHYRRRRYGRFHFIPSSAAITPLPHSPYFQSENYNLFAGGIRRELAPLRDSTTRNRFLHELIRVDFQQFNIEYGRIQHPWVVGIHQIRIIAQVEFHGKPTPEGVHQDGHEIFAVHLIARDNISGGVTRVFDLERNLLNEFTLLNPLDSYYIEDSRVMHEVTPIQVVHGEKQAIRDVLIVEYDSQQEF